MAAKILIVDDQAVMLRLIGYPLEAEGYTILTAMTGAEGLAKIQADQPDLIILDIMLPDVSGIDLCRRIRQGLGLIDLPVIILSGQTELNAKIQGLEAGADEYVTKPVDPKEMVVRVRSLLARTQRLRQVQPSSSRQQGKVISFIGAKGGVGTTTVALNVAQTLALRGRKAIAVELRSYYGSFSRHLNLAANMPNLSDLLEITARHINEQQITSRLKSCEGGLLVLPGPQRLKEYRDIQPEQAETIINTLAQIADTLLIDLPHMPSVANRSALRASQNVVIVLEAEPSSMAAAQALLELIRAWGVNSALIRLAVLNRTPSAHLIPITDIERDLGCSVAGVITAAPDHAVRAIALGKPLVLSAREALVANTLIELADRLTTTSARATI